jgi:LPPG:FO 2-phospho-L-lactate transferase
VQRWYQDPVNSVRFAGVDKSEPAPGVIDAILSATVVLLAPSNPVTSIGPILAVPGIVDALKQTNAPVVAISPIIGTKAVSGPADILMAAQGLPVSIVGVAQAYKEFLDILVVDNRDAKAAEALQKPGLRVHCANTVMSTSNEKADLARQILALFSAESAAHAGSDLS